MRDSSPRGIFLHWIANLEGQSVLFEHMDLHRHLNFNHTHSHEEGPFGHQISGNPTGAEVFAGTMQFQKSIIVLVGRGEKESALAVIDDKFCREFSDWTHNRVTDFNSDRVPAVKELLSLAGKFLQAHYT